jgi:hypothetical protein
MAAREMGGLSLADALSLCELLANVDPARYERAALVKRRPAGAGLPGYRVGWFPAIAALRALQVRPDNVAEDAEATQEIGMWPM